MQSSNLKNTASHYFDGLSSCYSNIIATHSSNKPLTCDDAIESAIQLVLHTHQAGKKIIFIGNGGSAAISSHIAIDYWKNGGMRAIAFNDTSLLTCIGNDYGYAHVFEKPIQMFADSGDLLIAISSSGKSANILNGVKAAQEKNCKVVTLSGFEEVNPLRKLGEVNFYVSSMSYGYVEITHLSICHAIADLIIERGVT